MTNLVSAIKSKFVLAAVTLASIAAFTLASPDEAQAAGWELQGAFGWLGEVHDGPGDMNGITFRLAGGYKINDWVGIFLNQDIGGTWDKDTGARWSHFVGATIVSADFFYTLGQVQLLGLVGLGAHYIGDTHWEHRHDNLKGDDNNSDGAFAFRIGVGATYMINSKLGVGLNFDYTLGAYETWNDHVLDLLLHIRYAF